MPTEIDTWRISPKSLSKLCINGGWIYGGGLAPHFFVFDFFTNFHFDFSKDLLEVLRFFPLLNHGGKIFEKNFFRLAVT